MNSSCAKQHFVLIKKKRREVEGAGEGEKKEKGKKRKRSFKISITEPKWHFGFVGFLLDWSYAYIYKHLVPQVDIFKCLI